MSYDYNGKGWRHSADKSYTEMEKKKNIVIRGGVSEIKWGEQFHQQDRVYDRKGISGAVNASGNNGLFIRKWKRN